MTEETNKPKQFLKGNLKVNEWTNKKDGEEFKSYTIEKIYKKDDEWKSTNNFSLQELIGLVFLINETYQKVKPLKE